MREETGNLWAVPADVRVITTNGTVKKDGCAVMGLGCAREAVERWPDTPKLLGRALQQFGLRVHVLWSPRVNKQGECTHHGLVSFPVKYNWWEKADLDLIRISAEQLVEIINWPDEERVALTRPGCGDGRLD